MVFGKMEKLIKNPKNTLKVRGELMEFELLTQREKELRKMAEELKEEHGCTALKLGTEVEDCSFEYINFINNKLVAGLLPVVVKIGGPEARNDIRELCKIGVAGLIAPMVESPYGLVKFVTALRDIVDPDRLKTMIKGINAETVTCYKKIDDILKTPEIEELNQITIGRGDLSGSIGKKVDDPEVMAMTKEITQKAQAVGLVVSVGGGITPVNAQRIVQEIKPDKVNSRHVVISVQDTPDIGVAFKKALEFESALMKYEISELDARSALLQRRIGKLEKRLAARPSV
jgi:hypothetical protein